MNTRTPQQLINSIKRVTDDIRQDRQKFRIEKKLEVERERIATTDKIAQDRIDSQEDIAQLRANVNLSKQKQ